MNNSGRNLRQVATYVLHFSSFLSTSQLYTSITSRVFGDFGDLRTEVPRHATVDTRRPRYVWYHMRTRARLALLRTWWVGYAGWALWRLVTGVARCGVATSPLVCGSVSACAVEALLRSSQCSALDPSVASSASSLLAGYSTAAGSPLPLGPVTVALLALRLVLQLTVHLTPLALGAIALHSLLGVSAAEFSGEVEGGSDRANWLWPSGQVGIAPWQVTPPRMSDPPLAAAAAVAAIESAAAAVAEAITRPVAAAAAMAARPPPPQAFSTPPSSPSLRDSDPSGSLSSALLSPPPLPSTAGRSRRRSVARTVRGSPGQGDDEGAVAASSAPEPSARRRPAGLASLATLPAHSDAVSPASGARSRGGADRTQSNHGTGSGGLFSPPALAKRLRAPAAAGPIYAHPDSALLIAASAAAPLGLGFQNAPQRTSSLSRFLSPEGIGGGSGSGAGHRLRIAILTVGTRGDVQPYITLGCALRDAGHAVVLSSTDDFEPLVLASGLEFARTGAPRITQPDSWVSGETRTVADMIRASAEAFVGHYDAVADGFTAACAGADVIVGTSMTITFALNIGEARGHAVPVWCAKLAPDLPTPAFAPPGATPSDLGTLNLARCYAYWIQVALAVGSAGINRKENGFRERLGLGPIVATTRLEEMGHTPMLLGWSTHLFPPPADYPAWALPCGFWLSGEGSDRFLTPAGLDPRVRRFISQETFTGGAGDDDDDAKGGSAMSRVRPLAVVTFGSMSLADDGMLLDILAVLRGTDGFNVIVLTGWKGLPPGTGPDAPPPGSAGKKGSRDGPPSHPYARDPRVLFWPELPHAWLFDAADVIIHHGGAGTTGRALASGKPSLIIPVLRWSDQVQWGRLVQQRGVGVVLDDGRPSRSAISAALRRLMLGDRKRAPFTGSLIGDRANGLGAQVRAEPSCATALVALESCLCNRVLPPAQADAVHPYELGAASVRNAHVLATLTPAQRMCMRNCVPCGRVRARMAAAAGLGGAVGHISRAASLG